MAFDEVLADRVREALMNQPALTEKKMFQGLCFMVNDKMCICVRGKELMCRIDPEKVSQEVERGNCREMVHNGSVMKGYIYVEENGYKKQKDFQRLIDLCVGFNEIAKSSKKAK